MKKLFTFLFLTIIGLNFITAQTDEFGNTGGNKVLSGLGLSLSYVNIINGSNFNLDSSGTIECWIYPNTVFSSPRTVISKGANTNLSFLFGINSGSLLYFRIGNTDYINTGGAIIPINVWTHVAVSWSGKPNYTVQFYVNGNLSGSPVTSNAAWVINSDAVRIGSSQGFPSQSFAGYIDEVKFYKKNISLNELLSNRYCGIGDYYVGAPIDINASNTYKNLFSSLTFNQTGSTAFDYIGSNSGIYTGSAINFGPVFGHPVPYNFALKFGGGTYDYITIPTNTIFDQSTDGTFEFWFKPKNVSTEQIIISKAASPSNISFLVGLSASGRLYLGLGNYIALNSNGETIDANKWNHIAISWVGLGSFYQVMFYKNGKINSSPVSIVRAYNTNTSPVIIGNSTFQNLPANGFLDELRLWNNSLTPEQVYTNMFVSSKSISNPNLLAAYDFDGSLQNFSTTTNITGSFNNGNVNYSRYSAYLNDTLQGAYSNALESHSTTINRNNSPNTFPANFLIRNPFLAIPDNNTTGVSDSLNYSGPFGNVSNVELFLALDHTYIGDLIVSITAPNGVTKNVVQNNAGAGKNILSFFNDGFADNVTGTTYLPPWGFIKPFQSFGNFSSSTVTGFWKIKCVDNAGTDVGVLKGWGLKFDVVTSNNNNQSTLPTEYNLNQNYPNPFNSQTVIKYELPKDGLVSIRIYDINGRVVKDLVNENHKAGYYEINYNSENLSSGVYYYKIVSRRFTKTMKMVLVK